MSPRKFCNKRSPGNWFVVVENSGRCQHEGDKLPSMLSYLLIEFSILFEIYVLKPFGDYICGMCLGRGFIH